LIKTGKPFPSINTSSFQVGVFIEPPACQQHPAVF